MASPFNTPKTHAPEPSSVRACAPAYSRRTFLAFGTCVLLSILAGCATSKNTVVDLPEAEQDRVRLTFFGNKHEPLNVNAIENILRSYSEAYPHTSIAYESIKGSAYYDALEKRLETGNADDVFIVDHDTVLAYGGEGHLAALDHLSSIDSFSQFALAQMRSEGSIYYVPTSISAFGLYCNTDLLSSCHVEVPRTFPQLLSACQTFLDAGITPIAANNDISLKTFAIARGLARIYADDRPEERIAALTNEPHALCALLRDGFEAVEQLLARECIDAHLALATEKTSDDLEQFAAGAFPFMLTGAWASARMHDMAPGLAYEVHPLPALDDGSVVAVNVDTRVGVNAKGPHVDEALRFVEHLTRPESIKSFANSMCSFSPLIGNAAPDDASLRPLADAFEEGNLVIGSDDNLRLPIWSAVRTCVAGMLEGDSALKAEERLLGLLAPEEADEA